VEEHQKVILTFKGLLDAQCVDVGKHIDVTSSGGSVIILKCILIEHF